jgi:hypothetical protein
MWRTVILEQYGAVLLAVAPDGEVGFISFGPSRDKDGKEKAEVYAISLRTSSSKVGSFWTLALKNNKGGFCHGISVTDSTRAVGYHKDADSPVLLIIDEGFCWSIASKPAATNAVTFRAVNGSSRPERRMTLSSDSPSTYSIA